MSWRKASYSRASLRSVARARLTPRLIRPKARVGPWARRRAHSRVRAGSSSWGTTRFTSPRRSAVTASTGSAVNISSRAFPIPTRRGRNHVPPESGTRPTRVNTWMKDARSLAIRRSAARARLAPAPAATPFTAARVGFSMVRSRRMILLYRARTTSPSDVSPGTWSLRSAPEQNARPAPVRTTHRTSSACSASRRASCSSCASRPSMALRTSGLFSVMRRTPSSVSTRSASYTCPPPLSAGLLPGPCGGTPSLQDVPDPLEHPVQHRLRQLARVGVLPTRVVGGHEDGEPRPQAVGRPVGEPQSLHPGAPAPEERPAGVEGHPPKRHNDLHVREQGELPLEEREAAGDLRGRRPVLGRGAAHHRRDVGLPEAQPVPAVAGGVARKHPARPVGPVRGGREAHHQHAGPGVPEARDRPPPVGPARELRLASGGDLLAIPPEPRAGRAGDDLPRQAGEALPLPAVPRLPPRPRPSTPARGGHPTAP